MADTNNIGQKLNDVIQSAALIDISLKSCHSECFVPSRSISPQNTVLNFNRNTEFVLSDEKDLLVCFASLDVKASPKGEGASESLFNISASYSLIYKLSNTALDNKALEVFASHNAYYNAYPYLREILQNMCARMDIEPVKLPLLKPLTKKELSK